MPGCSTVDGAEGGAASRGSLALSIGRPGDGLYVRRAIVHPRSRRTGATAGVRTVNSWRAR